MKRLNIGLVLGLFLLLAPAGAEAHILKTDGNIGAVLHIDPADDPVVGQVSTFIFEMKDKQNKFTTADCDCSFSVSKSGQQIYTQPLTANSDPTSLVASYTFSDRSVYQVILAGKPNGGADFQPFKLQYEIRVSRTGGAGQVSKSPTWLYWLFGGAVAVFALLFVIKMRRKAND